nr:hypothetical protein [Angustibacter aerolatus]
MAEPVDLRSALRGVLDAVEDASPVDAVQAATREPGGRARRVVRVVPDRGPVRTGAGADVARPGRGGVARRRRRAARRRGAGGAGRARPGAGGSGVPRAGRADAAAGLGRRRRSHERRRLDGARPGHRAR